MTEQPTRIDDPHSPDVPGHAGESGPTSASAPGPGPFSAPEISNILTLEAIMSSARRVRRTATICLAPDLEDAYEQAVDALGELVDARGNLLEEESLAGAEEATAQRDKVKALYEELQQHTYKVVFDGMVDEEWEVFEKTNRTSQGAIKDLNTYNARLIAACAVEPKLTEADVTAMRKRLSPKQMLVLSNTAYEACTTGGVDVPKLPSFWHAPKPGESSLS